MIQDYIQRAEVRLGAVEYLYFERVLGGCGSGILMQEKEKIPQGLHGDLEKLCDISRTLRRDRELAYYGSEDLTPSEFYQRKDAQEALQSATFAVEKVSEVLK